ncbi:Cytochrome P450 [Macleaya cordata]|uniref:Cytochrome P450 n=1 Tax=Macleaya cordata TaxID=56857 RepID=A0A200Q8Y6_MACCD|nr:Cytochrome P450 [Macleaya cordata]
MEIFFFFSNYYYYFLLFIFFLFVCNLLFKGSKNRPPSPLALPILGHLYLLNKPLPQALKHLSDCYGPVLLLRFGSQYILAVSSPSAVEECLTKNDVIFANRPPVIAGKHLGYNFTTLEWAPFGHHWRNLRRLTNIEIFSSSSLQASSNIRNEEVRNLIGQLFRKSSSLERFQDVDMKSMFFELTFNIVMKMVTRKRYTGDMNWSSDTIRDTFLPERLVNMVDFLPVLKWIGYQGTERNLLRMRRNKDLFLEGMIEENRNIKITAGDEGKKEKTMIDALLSLQEEEPETYTDEIIKGIIGLMFAAGIETQLVTLVSSLSLLLNHPEALTKLRTELDLHVEEGRILAESDLPKLPYLQCVIYESLRLHPPAPIPLPHQSSQVCTVGGYDIPRGTTLLVNVWAIHRDPKLWEEPAMFKPERFEAGVIRGDDRMDGFKWIPFGSGRRGCPGAGLAMRIVSLAVGALIQCFEWRKVDDDDDEQNKVLEPFSRAMYKPRMVHKDLFSQI